MHFFPDIFLAHYGSASAPPKKNKVLNDSTNKRKLRTSSPLKVPAKDFSKVHPIVTSTDVDKNFVQVDHSKAEVVLHQLTGSDLNDDDSKVDVGPTEVSQNKLKETQNPKRKNNIEGSELYDCEGPEIEISEQEKEFEEFDTPGKI